MMDRADLIVVALWLASVALMVWLAWEPWRRTRRIVGIELPGDTSDRVRSPLFVFTPAAALAAFPLVMSLAAHLSIRPADSPWVHPHLLLPFGLFALVGAVVVQLGFRRAFLRVARQRRAEADAKLAVFAKGAARSARQRSP